MKLLVCGGRTYMNREYIYAILDGLNPTKIVHGGCPGADTIAEQWARHKNDAGAKIRIYRHEAEWSKLGRAAGPIRNRAMLDIHPDIFMVVAFPGGVGTENMIGQALGFGIPVLLVPK